jgi:predicted O-methyltransferase YrrM
MDTRLSASDSQLDSYILSHIEAEPDYLYGLYRESNIRLIHGHMVSGHLQGRLLKMLVHMIRPRRVLEIGTFTGYSALCMASALEEGGRLVTYEINDEMEDFTRPWLEGSPWAGHIDFRIGNVLTGLPDDEPPFDLVFIDGNKRQYTEYYELSLKHLNDGGFILADNTLWDGHVVDTAYDRDAQTLGIRRFNELVARDHRVETVIIPLRDGLTLLRKR